MIVGDRTKTTDFSALPRDREEAFAQQSNATRKKRWAPKVRTGCTTCRNRHVKCDEAKPSCRRCVTARFSCEYPRQRSHKPESLRPLRMAPLQETEPPGWDLAQGARYFVTVMSPDYQDDIPNGFADGFVNFHISRFKSKPSFLMIITCHYIATLSAQNGYLARQGDFPALDHVWRVFYGYMLESIISLNRHIDSRSPIRYILYKVIDLLSVEVRIIDSPWRAHLNGFLGIVESYGGVDGVMRSSDRPPILALQFAVVYGLANNACTPVNDQISGFDSWSDQDTLRVYTNTYFPIFPCPSCLFLSIRQITRLRVESHRGAGGGTSSHLHTTANAIAVDVGRFSPCNWKESYRIPDEPFLSLFASTFKTATLLYGVLSLPAHLAIHFCQTEVNSTSHRRLTHTRLRLRARLIHALDEIFRADVRRKYLCTWPLAVLGAACYDASADEQEHVLGYIENIRRRSGVDCGAATLVDILPRFWESGQSAWDKCFYKSCQVLS